MIDRLAVIAKFGGKCAYCGDLISVKGMHVDHHVAKERAHQHPEIDVNGIDNLFPACASCNLWKSVNSIEQFRRQIEDQLNQLKSYSQYKLALRYGLIEERPHKVVFHFERWEK